MQREVRFRRVFLEERVLLVSAISSILHIFRAITTSRYLISQIHVFIIRFVVVLETTTRPF